MKTKEIKMFKNKKLKYGATSSTIVVLFVVAVVIVNLIMSTLSDKIKTSVDLTANKVFELNEDSKKFLSLLENDVEIIVINDEENFEMIDLYTVQANKVLKEYPKYSSKVKLSYVNPVKNPTFLSSYEEDVSKNSVIIKSGDKYKILSIRDLFNIEGSNYYGEPKIASSKAESAITSAMLYVSSETQTKIAMVKGYSESDDSGIVEILKSNNFDAVNVSILKEDIPMDAAAVFIIAPKKDYDDMGLEKIRKFMDNEGNHGKKLFVVLNAQNQNYTKLNELLNEYDIKISGGVTYELDPQFLIGSRNPFQYLSCDVDESYMGNPDNGKTYNIFVPASVPLEILDENNAKALFKTSNKSGIRPANDDKSWKPSKNDKQGPITIAASSSKNDSNVFVFGSYAAFDAGILSQSSIDNSAYFLNIFKTMRSDSDKMKDLQIQPVSLEDKNLGIKKIQAVWLNILFMAFIPLIVIIIGVVLIVIRKNKSMAIQKERS